MDGRLWVHSVWNAIETNKKAYYYYCAAKAALWNQNQSFMGRKRSATDMVPPKKSRLNGPVSTTGAKAQLHHGAGGIQLSTSPDISNKFGIICCPECKLDFNGTTHRVLQESCGHIKCRTCLIKNEDGCIQCKREVLLGKTCTETPETTRISNGTSGDFPSPSKALGLGWVSNNVSIKEDRNGTVESLHGIRLCTSSLQVEPYRSTYENVLNENGIISNGILKKNSNRRKSQLYNTKSERKPASASALRETNPECINSTNSSSKNENALDRTKNVSPPDFVLIPGLSSHLSASVGHSDTVSVHNNNISPIRCITSTLSFNLSSQKAGSSAYLNGRKAYSDTLNSVNTKLVGSSTYNNVVHDNSRLSKVSHEKPVGQETSVINSNDSHFNTICPSQLQELQLPIVTANCDSSRASSFIDNGLLIELSNSVSQSSTGSGDNSDGNTTGNAVEKKKKKRSPVFIHDHIKILGGDPQMYQCSICEKKFKTKAHIKYHEFCQNGEKPFRCEQCGQGFIAKSHYEYHLRTHTGERPYVCQKCGKGFNQRGKVTRHMRSHTGEKPFTCTTCGRGFANAQAMRSHHLIHTGERPFACQQCGKRFTGMTNLKKHIITHTGERPYMCVHCGKSFGLKWTLDLHMRTHSSERPYACDQCTRAFSNSKDLRRHLVIHSGERPFKCWLCKTAFRRKDNLDRHIKNTHNLSKEISKRLANEAAAEYMASKAAAVAASPGVTGVSIPILPPTSSSINVSFLRPASAVDDPDSISGNDCNDSRPSHSVIITAEVSPPASPSHRPIQPSVDSTNSSHLISPDVTKSEQSLCEAEVKGDETSSQEFSAIRAKESDATEKGESYDILDDTGEEEYLAKKRAEAANAANLGHQHPSEVRDQHNELHLSEDSSAENSDSENNQQSHSVSVRTQEVNGNTVSTARTKSDGIISKLLSNKEGFVELEPHMNYDEDPLNDIPKEDLFGFGNSPVSPLERSQTPDLNGLELFKEHYAEESSDIGNLRYAGTVENHIESNKHSEEEVVVKIEGYSITESDCQRRVETALDGHTNPVKYPNIDEAYEDFDDYQDEDITQKPMTEEDFEKERQEFETNAEANVKRNDKNESCSKNSNENEIQLNDQTSHSQNCVEPFPSLDGSITEDGSRKLSQGKHDTNISSSPSAEEIRNVVDKMKDSVCCKHDQCILSPSSFLNTNTVPRSSDIYIVKEKTSLAVSNEKVTESLNDTTSCNAYWQQETGSDTSHVLTIEQMPSNQTKNGQDECSDPTTSDNYFDFGHKQKGNIQENTNIRTYENTNIRTIQQVVPVAASETPELELTGSFTIPVQGAQFDPLGLLKDPVGTKEVAPIYAAAGVMREDNTTFNLIFAEAVGYAFGFNGQNKVVYAKSLPNQLLSIIPGHTGEIHAQTIAKPTSYIYDPTKQSEGEIKIIQDRGVCMAYTPLADQDKEFLQRLALTADYRDMVPPSFIRMHVEDQQRATHMNTTGDDIAQNEELMRKAHAIAAVGQMAKEAREKQLSMKRMLPQNNDSSLCVSATTSRTSPEYLDAKQPRVEEAEHSSPSVKMSSSTYQNSSQADTVNTIQNQLHHPGPRKHYLSTVRTASRQK